MILCSRPLSKFEIIVISVSDMLFNGYLKTGPKNHSISSSGCVTVFEEMYKSVVKRRRDGQV